MIINKDLFSCELNGPALRYEIGMSSRSNDIVHITGPHFPGRDNDLSIFRKELKGKLDDGERAVAYGMHVAEASGKILCTKCCTTTLEKESLLRRIEGRHEVASKHVKHWKCLHDFEVSAIIVPKCSGSGWFRNMQNI